MVVFLRMLLFAVLFVIYSSNAQQFASSVAHMRHSLRKMEVIRTQLININTKDFDDDGAAEGLLTVISNMNLMIDILSNGTVNQNPVLMYRVAIISVHQIHPRMKLLADYSKELSSLHDIMETNLPNLVDELETAFGIARIMSIYELNVTQIAADGGADTELSQLTLDEEIFICDVLSKKQAYKWAKACYENLLFRFNGAKAKQTPKQHIHVTLKMANALFHMDNYEEALRLLHLLRNGLLQLDNLNSVSKKAIEVLSGDILAYNAFLNGESERILHLQGIPRYAVRPDKTNSITQPYCKRPICSDSYLDGNAASFQFCHLTTHRHPLLILQPLKEEVIRQKPLVVLFHGLVPQSITERLIEHAEEKLQPAKVVTAAHSANFDEFESHTRFAKTAWLTDNSDEELDRFSDVLTAATRMKKSSGEDYQVGNYGVGGHYVAHYDYFDNSTFDTVIRQGDRLATLIIYLSNTAKGGHTVFPHTGISIPPAQGDAAFWFNLNPDMSPDPRSFHSGCPTIQGTKWVVNKWYHSFENFDWHRCPKDIKTRNNFDLTDLNFSDFDFSD